MDSSAIFKKLRFDDSKKTLIINAPTEYENLLTDIDYDKEFKSENKNSYDFVQVFATSQAELEKLIASIKTAGKHDCLFWICYPKLSGKIKSDMKRETIWKAFEIANLQAVTQISIDETWSALRGRPAEMIGK